MSYTITTEDRGHGIIAVFVTGPANEYDAIERAGKRYAKQNLTFAPGLSGGPCPLARSSRARGSRLATRSNCAVRGETA